MIYLIGLLFFIIAQGFFSGIETGLISLQKPRVKYGVKKNLKSAKILDFFIQNKKNLLATTLFGVNLSVVCSSLCANYATKYFGFSTNISLIITSVVMSLLLLFFEIIPKDWFRQAPYDRCLKFAFVLNTFYFIFALPINLLAKITGFIESIAQNKNEDSMKTMHRNDLNLLLKESEIANTIDSEAVKIIENSVEFFNIIANDVLIKKKDVFSIHINDTIQDAINLCNKYSFSMIPVHIKNGEWIGLFNIYDVILTIPYNEWRKRKVTGFLKPVATVSKSANVVSILSEMKNSNPLLFVSEHLKNKSEQQIGIITQIDITKRIFS